MYLWSPPGTGRVVRVRMEGLLGERFLAGAVLHTGPQPFQLAERIYALPICTLWA